MLLNKIEDTVTIINKGIELSEIKKNNKNVLNLNHSLADINNLMIHIIGMMKQFEERGNEVEIKLNIKTYKQKLIEISQLIKTGVIPSEQSLMELKRNLRDANQTIDEVWKNGVKEKIMPIINMLDLLKGILQNVDEVNHVINQLKKLLEMNPKVDSFTRLDNWLKRGELIINNLHLNRNIEVFLRKVYSRNATAADLNEEVFEWLKEHDLLRNLKLSFSR